MRSRARGLGVGVHPRVLLFPIRLCERGLRALALRELVFHALAAPSPEVITDVATRHRTTRREDPRAPRPHERRHRRGRRRAAQRRAARARSALRRGRLGPRPHGRSGGRAFAACQRPGTRPQDGARGREQRRQRARRRRRTRARQSSSRAPLPIRLQATDRPGAARRDDERQAPLHAEEALARWHGRPRPRAARPARQGLRADPAAKVPHGALPRCAELACQGARGGRAPRRGSPVAGRRTRSCSPNISTLPSKTPPTASSPV